MLSNDTKIHISIIERFAIELLAKNPKLGIGEAFTIAEGMVNYSKEHKKQTVADDVYFRLKIDISDDRSVFNPKILNLDTKWNIQGVVRTFPRNPNKNIQDITYNHNSIVDIFTTIEPAFRNRVTTILLKENQIAGKIYFISVSGTTVYVDENNKVSITR